MMGLTSQGVPGIRRIHILEPPRRRAFRHPDRKPLLRLVLECTHHGMLEERPLHLQTLTPFFNPFQLMRISAPMRQGAELTILLVPFDLRVESLPLLWVPNPTRYESRRARFWLLISTHKDGKQ